ncbi:hypothetical protein H310_02649 [Aphanomyces invadans]|uniref:Uncharacterized protein n=1 Tax=Aphanomyces invadans TaxID=157072 RepID=A0A024UL87_9STRA|nr:hypothetical protein H310_02649 [Aphanomyces invadans]ETW06373.1 hypothetical protein H310_02649 [Aphanomyces invadans]|eukprot:XP_008864448.1 hypothetical protein H310_02649 [Aphanomyces invadans]
MELAYQYTKPRRTFGRYCDFKHVDAKVIESIPSTDQFDHDYVKRRPMIGRLDTTPDMSEHEVNTERLVTKNSSMRHVEGGWPKDVDSAEQNDVQRFRKKVEKDDEYKQAVKFLGPVAERGLKQNNTINIYQDYFAHMGEPATTEQPSAKGLAVFRDPESVRRTVSKIDWHPESPQRMAACYCILNFQDPKFVNSRMPSNSYIWDVMNPNTPEVVLKPLSPLCCLRYNPKSVDQLVGGSYNGLISFFDIRKSGSSPVETSMIEHSHHDPVYDVFWISSKTGNQCCSVSTDGSMLWWDIRHLAQPTHRILLSDKDGQVLGGSSMEYNTEAGPTKYLVGTEQGVVLSVNLRNIKQNNGIVVYDTGAGKHHGPIYTIQRNPSHNKFFMTIGDWTARVWCEDLKTPIMSTTYHESYVTAGCWSPTRAGVFFVTRMDGVVDVWDFFYRQNVAAYSHKVGDVPLSAISVQGNSQSGGKLVAVGDSNGMISLLEVSDGLAIPQSNEKAAINGMFERETKREKNLEAREKEQKRKKATMDEGKVDELPSTKDEKMEELLRTVDANFLNMIKEAEDTENKNMEHKTDSMKPGDEDN